MTTVKAYYDGVTFIPIEPVYIQKGNVVSLSILQDEQESQKAFEKFATFRKLTSEIHELNQIEPYPPELDDLLQDRVNFTRILDL